MQSAHLAIDLGASSGRALLGFLSTEPKTLRVTEVHRFEHHAIDTPTGPVWDFTGIVNEVLTGLRLAAKAASEADATLRSVGVDTWGVDFTVVGENGDIIGLPKCYRDPANAEAREAVLNGIDGGVKALYARGGIQPMPFNTLFQLYGRQRRAAATVPESGRVQLMPDLIHYVLSGNTSNERTIASTGSWLTAGVGEWDVSLLDSLGFPRDLFGLLIDPGTSLGEVRPSLASELGIPSSVEVVAPAAHDTASAIAAVPVTGRESESWAYLSSGTWSLLGMELREPITRPEALHGGFTNELGVPRDGRPTVRFLRNIGGLWLIQELQRDLARHGTTLDFAELVDLADSAEPFRTYIDPNAEDLAAPGNSVAKLGGHAKRTGQPVPETPGQLARCCLESLAMCYAATIDRLEGVTGRQVEALYAVGGGIQNQLLNRLTAAAIGRPMFIGPIEATAVGNLLVQAMGLELVRDLDEIREVVARSFPIERVDAIAAAGDWRAERQRYESIVAHP